MRWRGENGVGDTASGSGGLDNRGRRELRDIPGEHAARAETRWVRAIGDARDECKQLTARRRRQR
jgi:hypothetical protein